MRSHGEASKLFARKHGCKLSYRWYGYDVDCPSGRYLVREYAKRIAITYNEFVEAKKFHPSLVIVDSEGNPVAILPYSEWSRAAVLGEEIESPIGRFKLKLTKGQLGERVELIVGPASAKILRKIVEELGDFDEVVKQLAICLGLRQP